MIKKVKIEEAVGMILAHDVTKVVPGKFKGPAFHRGHIIREEDIPEFRSIGKEHFYVLELEKGEIHEEEAALRIARAITGSGLRLSKPHEGRVDLIAEQTGLLKINVAALDEINSLGDIIIATIYDNTVCQKGAVVAGTRIIPLYIHNGQLIKSEQIAKQHEPIISLVPMKPSSISIIITGNEVFKGQIQDGFFPLLQKKAKALDCVINNQVIVPDDSDAIARAILEFEASGSEIVLCCSGMSKDPDDITPEGIRKSGAQVYFYGLPVPPGAMSLYAKLNQMHILGVPACFLYAPTTAFDILLPRILTGEELTFIETRKLGHGGLCLKNLECAGVPAPPSQNVNPILSKSE
ncbi:MAG: Molybdopterin molybdenumtransferase [Thermoproteota archaeon]|nr:Molybdopterin molybdenumtransferase [Thermoproteota archaeon]